ncbi:hypothetical protein [Terrihabitans sp. B22-R8]|uniref:hypothetical protein n=1 Tax=Terrihabitans sp. B22-R8 TaxID=3425128 RepID=UPI00403C9A97
MPGFKRLLGAYQYDIKADIKKADTQMALLCGLDPQQARAGLPKSAFANIPIHRDDYDRVTTRLSAAIETGGLFLECFRVRDQHDQERIALGSAWSYINDEGREILSGVILDLTEETAISTSDPTPLELLTDICLAARHLSKATNNGVVTHLLDMTLLELGGNISQALQKPRHLSH